MADQAARACRLVSATLTLILLAWRDAIIFALYAHFPFSSAGSRVLVQEER